MKRLVPSIVIAVLMVVAAGAGYALTPRTLMAEMRDRVVLDEMIPAHFGEWKELPNVVPVQVSPEVQATLDLVYDQVLARTYTNSNGDRVMLSIAYGGQQSKNLQLHRPEVCYTAQGFQVEARNRTAIDIGNSNVDVVRLLGKLGPRQEPITYWMRVGDTVATSGFDQAIVRYRNGLQGIVPDGTLIRVSSIGADVDSQFRVQEAFLRALVSAVPERSRSFLLGEPR